ncbi:unnamed protein product [Tenebrio molitor]|nr:unnamed protein product [Tenebrio molitor]
MWASATTILHNYLTFSNGTSRCCIQSLKLPFKKHFHCCYGAKTQKPNDYLVIIFLNEFVQRIISRDGKRCAVFRPIKIFPTTVCEDKCPTREQRIQINNSTCQKQNVRC